MSDRLPEIQIKNDHLKDGALLLNILVENNISSEIVENIISKFYDDKPDSGIIKSKVDMYIESYKNE